MTSLAARVPFISTWARERLQTLTSPDTPTISASTMAAGPLPPSDGVSAILISLPAHGTDDLIDLVYFF